MLKEIHQKDERLEGVFFSFLVKIIIAGSYLLLFVCRHIDVPSPSVLLRAS
jgi:hypothetical protein